jgi:hypothetical protein
MQQAYIENLSCACNTNKMFSRMVVGVLARNSMAYQVCKSKLKCYSYLTSIDRKKCREQLWQLELQLRAMAFFSLLFYSCVHTAVDLRHLSMYAVPSQNWTVSGRNLYNTNMIPKIVFLARNRRVTARPNELYGLYGRWGS